MNFVKIRPYKYSDEAQVINIWNQSLIKDPVSSDIFQKR